MPARARCMWSKSELTRQTCSVGLKKGGRETYDACQTRGIHIEAQTQRRAQRK